ncbi:MAG: sigma-70 family RNA polymerase sigma factor [Polyangiaceae bacterium]
MITASKLAALERHRKRLWGLCYRMVGDRAVADDLCQEALARALEREAQASEEHFEGWLYRVATTTCLDALRSRRRSADAVSIVDPLVLDDAPFVDDASPSESRLLKREDLRLAVLTTLRRLAPRQRAVLILRDVLDRSTAETAEALGLSITNTKVLLHRARATLAAEHRVEACDEPVDGALVERLSGALEVGDIDAVTSLLATDVWGLVDDGRGRRRPTLGALAVSRQWRNALSRYGRADRIARVVLNGEPSLLAYVGGAALAAVHVESCEGAIVSIRVILDPPRLAKLGIAAHDRRG